MSYLEDRLNPGEREKMSDADYAYYRACLIKTRLRQLTEDIVQALCGEAIADLADRKTEFVTLHNELRVLEGKEPREIVE